MKEEFNSKQIKPEDFLNTHCSNKDEYELNSFLADLNKQIATSNSSRKALIKQNFSKFLLCKNTIEKIIKDGNLKKTNIKEILKESNEMKENFLKIISKAQINLEEEKNRREREYLENKYKYIFNVSFFKESFEAKDYGGFVLIYKKAKKEYKILKESEYIKRLWKEIRFYRNSICEELAMKIELRETHEEIILYYFSVYFKLKGKKHKNKIGNTLLTNLKIYLHNSCENISLIEIDPLLFYTYKVINIIKDFFMKDLMIKELFKSLNFLIEKYKNEELIIYSIFLSKIKEFYNKIRIENMLSLSFIKQFEILESCICKNVLKNEKNLQKILKKVLTIFNKKIVKKELQNKLVKFIKYKPPALKYLEKINKLQFELNSLNSILNTFDESFDYTFLEDFDNKIQKEEILAFSDLNIRDGTNEEILMIAVNLKNRIPISFPKLVEIRKDVFLKNDFLKFFLQKFMKNYEPLEIPQSEKFKEIYKSFGFLII